MNYYDYDLTKADECIKLANDISDEYSMICRSLNDSYSDIPAIWSGEAAEKYLKKYEELLTDMHITDLKLNELRNLTLQKESHFRTLEKNTLKSITGW